MREKSKILSRNPISYAGYLARMEQWVDEGASSGALQNEAMSRYTALNLRRMRRIDKQLRLKLELVEAVNEMDTAVVCIAITESWCGDAAQNLPYLAALSEHCSNMELALVLRDDNPDYMDAFLTNGGRSIPKAIFYRKEDEQPFATWGPRPKPLQSMVMEYKSRVGEKMSFEKFAESVQLWYKQDAGQHIQKELLSIFRSSKELSLAK